MIWVLALLAGVTVGVVPWCLGVCRHPPTVRLDADRPTHGDLGDEVRFIPTGLDVSTVEVPDGGILVIRCRCVETGQVEDGEICPHVEAITLQCRMEGKMTVVAQLSAGETIEAITAEAMADAGWIRRPKRTRVENLDADGQVIPTPTGAQALADFLTESGHGLPGEPAPRPTGDETDAE